MKHLKVPGSLLKILNPALCLLAFFAAFMVLTNGIPLVQWGVWQRYGSRSGIRAGLLCFFIPFALTYFLSSKEDREKLQLIRWWKKIQNFPLLATAGVFFVLYSAAQLAVAFAAHRVLETRGYDLGIFAQAVWNTLHGDFLYSSLKGGICLLGDHFSPILAAAAPFYALWPDPRMLFILQTAAVAFGFFGIAKLAFEKTGDRAFSLMLLIAYYFDRPMRSALRSDFRPEALAQPFIFLALWFMEKNRKTLFFLSVLAVMSGKENMLGVAAVMGFYVFVFKRWYKMGAAVMILSVGLFYAETQWLIPKLSRATYEYQGYYGSLLAGHGGGLIRKIFSGDSISYIVQMLGPFLFLPILHLPTFLLALPVLAQNTLSGYAPMRSMNEHYALGLTPFLYAGTIHAWAVLQTKYGNRFAAFRKPLMMTFLFVSLLSSAPSDYHHYQERLKQMTPHRNLIFDALRRVPPRAVVVTHNRIIAQIPNRKYIFPVSMPDGVQKAESVAGPEGPIVVIMERSLWVPKDQGMEWGEAGAFMRARGYETELDQDGLLIFFKK